MPDDVLATIRYTGTINPTEGETDAANRLLYPYLPDEGLIDAVNLAILLKRPLLVTGEPGSGKTCLAPAIAYELRHRYFPKEKQQNYFPYYVKSTSHGLDVCYTYDYVGRLRDSQIASSPHLLTEELKNTRERSANASNYIMLGALGKAMRLNEPSVVLIDEIDKAEADFSNDLLSELDTKSFYIKETGDTETVQPKAMPIVIITSNNERELPDAFLRRCLFYHIEFPDRKNLEQIVKTRFRGDVSNELVSNALTRFMELRDAMLAEKGEQGKKVSTSELIDWFDVLRHFPDDIALQEVNGKMPASLLLKSWPDHQKYIHLLEPRA